MKFLIFAFVTAFILGDHGTLQVKQISECSPDELIKMFREYSLGVVNAALEPIHNGTNIIKEGASECLSGIDVYKYVNDFDAVLATISIAKDYPKITNIDKTDAELMKNIRVILAVLQTSQSKLNEFSEDEMLKKYLLRPNQAASSSAGSSNNENLLKCFRTLLGVQWNEIFFGKFIRGMEVIRELMTHDFIPNARQVAYISQEISTSKLEIPPSKTDTELEAFIVQLV